MCFRDAFSRNRQPTIIPTPNPNVVIGEAKQMSPNDIQRINRLYCSMLNMFFSCEKTAFVHLYLPAEITTIQNLKHFNQDCVAAKQLGGHISTPTLLYAGLFSRGYSFSLLFLTHGLVFSVMSCSLFLIG